MKGLIIATVALSTGILSVNSDAINCTNIPTWDAKAVYTHDMQAQEAGKAYKANWWSQNHNPTNFSGANQEWSLLGLCNSTTSSKAPVSSTSKSASISSAAISSKQASSVSPKSSLSVASSISSSLSQQSTKLTGAVFTGEIEGPAVDVNGDLYVANFNHAGSIGKIKNGSTAVELFIDLPKGSISSGIRFDAANNMYATDYIGHNIYKINVTTKQISVYAHNASMSQPNDLTIMANGIILASDPDWSKDSGQLWRININGTTTLLTSTMGTTNGITLSPDNKTLYVNESVQRIIWKFDVDAAGNISNKTKFKEFPDGGLDGMRTDPNGNLYVARYGTGTVIKISPAGVILREVKLFGTNPTNVTLSHDFKKCFVTLQDKFWVEVFNLE